MKWQSWHKVAFVGFIGLAGSALAVGCVVSSDDPDEDGSGGTGGGTGGTGGGTGGSGGGTGGSGGGTGGSGGSTGGSGGSGGSGGGAVMCDLDGGLSQTPGSCVNNDAANACAECIEGACCSAAERCAATDPDNPCNFGGPDGMGEIGAFQECVFNAQLDGGTASADTINECATDPTVLTPGCSTVSDTTNDLIACMNTECFQACLEVQ